MASTDVSQVLAGIKSLIANPPQDKATRLELYESLKDLSTVIEDPHDTICRVVYSVSRHVKYTFRNIRH
jgi:hypothetical protein